MSSDAERADAESACLAPVDVGYRPPSFFLLLVR